MVPNCAPWAKFAIADCLVKLKRAIVYVRQTRAINLGLTTLCMPEKRVFVWKSELFHQSIGRPFAKQFALCYRTVVLSVCLSVTLVYCGQTVGQIKMTVGMQVGLGPGHTVLDVDPAPPPKKKGAQLPSPNFRHMSVVAKQLDGLRCHLVWR